MIKCSLLHTFLILITVFLSLPSFADSPSPHSEPTAWKEIHQLYSAGNFGELVRVLELHPQDDPMYHYNLGTAFLQLGRLGPALAHLEKANRLNPHDPSTQSNLNIARSRVFDSIGPDQIDPASSWAEQLSARIELDEVRATLGLVGLLTVLFATRAYLKTRRWRHVFQNPATLLGAICFLLTSTVYGIQRWTESTPAAICLERQSIRSGPGQRYLELTQVPEGSKVRVLSSSNTSEESATQPESWLQVRYSKDGIGWMKASKLLVL